MLFAGREDDLLWWVEGKWAGVDCEPEQLGRDRTRVGGNKLSVRGESFACERQRDRTRVFCLALFEPLVLFFLMESHFYYDKCKYEPLTKSLLVTSAP